MFSFTHTGAASFNPEVDLPALPLHLADCLRSVHARSVETEGNRVAFTGGLFRLVSNWNVLVPFGFGDLTVHIDAREVRYRLSFRQLVFAGTALVGLIAAFAVSAFLASGSSSWQPLLFIPLLWIWLVVVNLTIAIPRFKDFVRRAIETAPRHDIPSHPLPHQ
jgi:hypothetical protein